jgi:hypothetical protein
MMTLTLLRRCFIGRGTTIGLSILYQKPFALNYSKSTIINYMKKVHLKAHKAFCEAHPNCENAVDFGVYEIFPPDEIQDFARNNYKPSEHRD